MGFVMHFYIIFGTNLIIKGPVQIAVFFAYFSVLQKRNIKRNKTFARIVFGTNAILETWSGPPGSIEEAMRQEGAPPPLWAPRSSTDLLLSPIYTLIP